MDWLPAFKTERKAIAGIIKSIDNIWEHLNVEIKHHDHASPYNVLSTTPSFFDLTNIQQGITGGDVHGIDTGYRDGDKIRLKSINIKYRASNAGTAGSTQVLNLMVLKHYDNFADQGPLNTEIFDIHSSDDWALRLTRPEFRKTYKVLHRTRLNLSDDTLQGNTLYKNIFIKPKNRAGTSIEWEGPNTDSPNNGKYYLVAWSQIPNTVGLSFTSRLTYVDN